MIIAVLLVIVLAIPAALLYGLYRLISKPFRKGRKKRKSKEVHIPFKNFGKGPKDIGNIISKAMKSKDGNTDFDKDEFIKPTTSFSVIYKKQRLLIISNKIIQTIYETTLAQLRKDLPYTLIV